MNIEDFKVIEAKAAAPVQKPPATEDQNLIEKMRALLFKAGLCDGCGTEIQHDITEPFASCKCEGGGVMEASIIPLIAAWRHNFFVLKQVITKEQYESVKHQLLMEVFADDDKSPITEAKAAAEHDRLRDLLQEAQGNMVRTRSDRNKDEYNMWKQKVAELEIAVYNAFKAYMDTQD